MLAARRLPVVLVVVALAAGCGAAGTSRKPRAATPSAATGAAGPSNRIDMSSAESAARTIVAQQTGATVRAVRCPSEAALEVGSDIACTATGADGTTAPVVMTVKDARGDVDLRPLALLQTSSAASLIAGALTHEYGATVQVVCPDLVSARKNTTMTCHATESGVSHRVLVTVKDNQRSLTYRIE
jgi:hypothetical protein